MTSYLAGAVRVSVPATSANLGPGFDALGLALDLRDEVTVELLAGEGPPEITVTGEGADDVPRDERHLVHRAMVEAFGVMGCVVPRVRLACRNAVPHGRGLGSSSAAIVAGICAARALVGGGSLLLGDEAALALAARLEGHPDNVAPALLGGFTIAWSEADGAHAVVAGVDPRVVPVALVPPVPLATTVARGLLPAAVPHADAAANAARAALLVAALSWQPELLLSATEDRLHQDAREPAMPATLALLRDLRADGLPAVVSGAGPTVLVLADAGSADRAAARCPAGWRVRRLDVDRRGAVVDLPG